MPQASLLPPICELSFWGDEVVRLLGRWSFFRGDSQVIEHLGPRERLRAGWVVQGHS
jgi:hypothetical protein